MMIRKLILILLIMVLTSPFVVAEEKALQNSLSIKLLFPSTSGVIMKAPAPILEAQEISGQIVIDIQPRPSSMEKDRYLVEYYLDDQLIYETTGFDEKDPARGAFGYIFDSTKYEDGRHKLVVNFWDRSGPSAIGMREIVIKNRTGA